MTKRSPTARSLAPRMVATLALPAALLGCTTPTAPPAPPSGGHSITLSFPLFESSVEPVLSRRGCDAGGDCHGGGIRGTLQLSPAGAKDATYDFNQVVLQVWPAARDTSPILTAPLALDAGGTAHPYKPFATVGDSDYLAIRAWIDAGTVR